MKRILFVAISVFTFTLIASAQPCRQLKPGMTMSEVKGLFTNPDEIKVLGTDTDTGNELAVWHYGNQRVVFKGNEVEKVVADGKGEDELLRKFKNNLITKEELFTQLEELNRRACE